MAKSRSFFAKLKFRIFCNISVYFTKLVSFKNMMREGNWSFKCKYNMQGCIQNKAHKMEYFGKTVSGYKVSMPLTCLF